MKKSRFYRALLFLMALLFSSTGYAMFEVLPKDSFYVAYYANCQSGWFPKGKPILLSPCYDGQIHLGYQFDRWIGDTLYITEGSAKDSLIYITCPDSVNEISLRASYKLKSYNLEIINGYIDLLGKPSQTTIQYQDRVYIDANPAPKGMVFKEWIGDTAYCSNSKSTFTKVTMPAKDIYLEAVYQYPLFNLTVYYGSGSGKYKAGDTVEINCSDPYSFTKWVGDIDFVNEKYECSTFLIMPETDISISEEWHCTINTVQINLYSICGQSVEDVSIEFAGEKYITDSTGSLTISVPYGNYNLIIAYGLYDTTRTNINISEPYESIDVHLICEGIFSITKNLTDVYPNPASEKLFIDIPKAAERLEIYDMQGKLIMQTAAIEVGVHSIDVSALAEGIYVVLVQTGDGVYKSKVEVRR